MVFYHQSLYDTLWVFQSVLDTLLSVYIKVYLIHFWVYQSVFDTLLSVSKCVWYTFECIKVYLIHFWVYQSVFDTLLSVSKLYQKWIKQGVQFWPAQMCIKVQTGSARHRTGVTPLTFFLIEMSRILFFIPMSNYDVVSFPPYAKYC